MKRRILSIVVCCLVFFTTGPIALAGSCSSPTAPEGTIEYNSSYHVAQYCNGTTWVGFSAIQPSSGGSCSNPSRPEGTVLYNTDYHALQYCNGTNWIKAGGGTGSIGQVCQVLPYTATSVWTTPGYGNPTVIAGDGTYIYIGDTSGYITALTFNTSTHAWTQKGYYSTGGNIVSLIMGGGYIFVGSSSGSIIALSFNGTAFTSLANSAVSANPNMLLYQGGYLFADDYNNSTHLYALSFNGTAFTTVASYTAGGGTVGVTGDGTYIYTASVYGNSQILTFNGTAFTLLASASVTPPFFSDGTYVYGSNTSTTGLSAYTFNGSALTLVGSISMNTGHYQNTVPLTQGVGGFYLPDESVDYFTFNGTSFAYKASLRPTNGYGRHNVYSDGTYLYGPDSSDKVQAFPLCI